MSLATTSRRLGKRAITAEELEVSVGEGPETRALLRAFSYDFSPEDRVGIIGPNGVGKSSLLEVIAGVADRSYGIHVAKIAGLPQAVISRAQTVLERLEREGSKAPAAGLADELPLFAASMPAVPPRESAIESKLTQVIADELSPREALALVYELKGLLGARKP